MLKAVIFDMDGVIVDSEPLHARAARETVAAQGIDLPLDYFLGFVGSTTRHMYEEIRERHGLTASVEELLSLDRENCRFLTARMGRNPVDGAIPLIQKLHAQGMRLAIASSSTPEQIREVLDEFGIASCFDAIASGALLGRPKPAPDVFLEALRQLGVPREEAIVIEDSKNGVLAAAAARIACVGLRNPHSGHQDLDRAIAVTDSLSSLDLSFLDQMACRYCGMPLTVLETERAALRELRCEDIPALYAICQKEGVCRYLPPLSSLEEEVEKHAAYIRNAYHFYGYGLWGVFRKENGALVGKAGIESLMVQGKAELELSYLIDPAFQNQGLATECGRAILRFARRELGASRVCAIIAEGNEASVRVARKLGMEREGKLRWEGFDCLHFATS